MSNIADGEDSRRARLERERRALQVFQPSCDRDRALADLGLKQ